MMNYILPVYILKGKYFVGSALVLVLFLVTAFISALIGMKILPVIRYILISNPEFNNEVYVPSLFLSLLAGLRGAITIGGLAVAIKLVKYWHLKEQRILLLQKENIESQLQLLKAQVHPHFLFNTLNNIFSYTQTTAPIAANLVAGLSDILRYMLYEGNKSLVSLNKEFEMIKDYIRLESIRYGNKLEIHTDIPGETNNLVIAPLLLLPLIENCFKHGTSQILEQPWINLHIDLHGNQLNMKLLNGKSNDPSHTYEHAQIGIENVQKRLHLLYPGKHSFSISNKKDVFIVNLKIDLSSENTENSQLTHKSRQYHA